MNNISILKLHFFHSLLHFFEFKNFEISKKFFFQKLSSMMIILNRFSKTIVRNRVFVICVFENFLIFHSFFKKRQNQKKLK